MLSPHISIVIPVKNGAQTINDCIQGIQKQTLYELCEIIIIDSGSTDGTIEILKNYNIGLYRIPSEEFNHGATRNYGVSLANGKFVVMTVQDAVPTDDQWLEKMIRHFEDPEVVGVCGQQTVPHHPDKNPHQWFRPISAPSARTVQFKKGEFDVLPGVEQKKNCSWDDVTAMYRKDVLKSIPFQRVMFGEDMLWAKDALTDGKKLVYDASARVEHYHHQNPDYTYRRTLIVWYFTYMTFNLVRDSAYKWMDYIVVIYRNYKWRLNVKWIFHNWVIIYYHRKAVKHFYERVRSGRIQELEKYLEINIPQGRTVS